MENLDATGMQDVTSYAPARITLKALLGFVFGALIGGMGALAWWATANGDMNPTKPGDMPVWWMYIVAAGLLLMGIAFVMGAVGATISAFARDCYFKAAPEGIAIRVPKQRMFGRFRVTEHNIRWSEIKQVVRFIHRINLIPVSSELRIEPSAGKTVVIPRHYFQASVKEIQQRLMEIKALVGR